MRIISLNKSLAIAQFYLPRPASDQRRPFQPGDVVTGVPGVVGSMPQKFKVNAVMPNGNLDLTDLETGRRMPNCPFNGLKNNREVPRWQLVKQP